MKQTVIRILTLLSRVLFHVMAVLFGIVLVGGMILRENSESITPMLNQKSYIVVDTGDEDFEEGDDQYFTSDKSSVAEMKEYTGELIEEIAAGGVALLKNENNVLPMDEGDTVSFFSVSSADVVYAGGGSSGANTSGVVSLRDGVKAAGLSVNENLWNWYSSSSTIEKYGRGEAGNQFNLSFAIGDASWSEIASGAKENRNDTKGGVAVFVLARNGGEGKDISYANDLDYLTDTVDDKPVDYTNGDYLQLSAKEKDVLSNLKRLKEDGVFSGIAVLINSAYALQCDFADDPAYGIDSVLWAGNWGTTGAYAIGDILAGKVNPSGRITDTFWEHNYLNPVLANFEIANYNEVLTDMEKTGEADGGTNKYVVYQEGIYNGYRYTETRYEDYVLNQGNAGAFDYGNTVSYPFGAGMSYTTFAYSGFDVAYDERTDEYTATVTVTNTGNVAGKEAVQLYLQKPYTAEDKENGVEKAAVELVGFAKTGLLDANGGENDSETLKIVIDGEQFASYDATHPNADGTTGTYTREAGTYYLTAATDAHAAVNNILEKKATAQQKERMDQPGDAGLVKGFDLAADYTKYAVSSVTGNPVYNQFSNADLNLYAGKGGNSVKYISRSDWEGTVKYGTDASGADLGNEVKITATPQMKSDVAIPTISPDSTPYPLYGEAPVYSLVDLRLDEIPYDDEMWEIFLDQLSWDDTVRLLSAGQRKTLAISDPINKPETIDHNGATGPVKEYNNNEENNYGLAVKNNDPDKGTTPNIYPCNGLVASTFDAALVEEFGKAMGEDCLWAGYNGLYGTGVNIHRSGYGGRAFEYYSEDPVLSGEIAAAEVRGIQSYGVYCYMKHCVLNELENNREGLCVWANEQTIREVYLRAFEIVLKPVENGGGGAWNVMTGFNRLGLEWNGEQGFCNTVLRDEFGMRGFAVTDWFDNRTWYMKSYAAIMNGNDLPDGQYTAADDDLNKYRTGYGELAWAMRESAHRILYTVAHSNAMNGYHSGMRVITITPQWIKLLNAATVGVNVAFGVSAAFFVVMLILGNFGTIRAGFSRGKGGVR